MNRERFKILCCPIPPQHKATGAGFGEFLHPDHIRPPSGNHPGRHAGHPRIQGKIEDQERTRRMGPQLFKHPGCGGGAAHELLIFHRPEIPDINRRKSHDESEAHPGQRHVGKQG